MSRVEEAVQQIRMNVVTADDADGLLKELVRQVAVLVDEGHGTEEDADELGRISEKLQANLIDQDLS